MSIASRIPKPLKDFVKSTFEREYYALLYWRRYHAATRNMGDQSAERESRFDELVARSTGQAAMQVGVRGQKYAPHWKSVDLYDTSPLIDYNYDIHDLQFEDNGFDFIACKAVLEHVHDPVTAISEMHRVLKPGGEIWIEVPMNQPYHPSPNDYWRVTPEGMRVWMHDFEELACGLFAIHKSAIYNAIFYHGRKPE